MLHFTFQNQDVAPAYVQAMTSDGDGRLTHAYMIEVAAGATKTFSTAIAGMVFVARNNQDAPGVLLPRGVPPANVEKPADVPVDPAGSADVVRVSERAPEHAAEHAE